MKEKRYNKKDILRDIGPDFIRRKLRPGPLKIVLSIVTVLIAIFLGVVFIDQLGTITVLAVLGAIFVIFGLVIFLHLDEISDVVFTREYEKAIIAGAAGSDVEFLMIVRKNHEVIYYNPACRQYFTYQTPGESDGLEALLDSMEINEEAKEQLFASIIAGRHARLSINLTNVSGDEHRVNLSLNPIERPQGYFVLRATKYLPRGINEEKAVNINITSTDVTASLEEVFDEMPWGVFKTKEDGELIYVNHKLANILGYQPEELLDKKSSFRDIIFGENLDVGSFNQRFEGNIAFKTKEGKSCRMFLKQVLVEGDKKPEYYRCGFAVKIEKERRQSASRSDAKIANTTIKIQEPFEEKDMENVWQNFVDESPIAIALIDDKSNIIRSNIAFNEFVSKIGVMQDNLLDIFNEESKNNFNKLLKNNAILDDIERKPIEIGCAGKDEYCASLLLTKMNGSIKGANNIVYLIDNTEQKDLEKKFVQSQKMQAVGQLAGGIAHDFNNLLTAMIGFCDLLLLRHSPSDESFADVMQIKQNANRAANLVRQLLAFSRKQTLQPEVVDIADTFAEISNLIRRLIGENIELKIKHGRGLATVKVDQGQLEQVLVNLCVNARDAMDAKGILTIRTRNCVVNEENPIPKNLIGANHDEKIADGEYVVIEVEDTGKGMSDKVQRQIFEPFFTTKDVGEGTGLGLATVYGIIQQTGGYVFVSSKKGKGTTFYLFIKQYLEEEGADNKIEKKADIVEDLTGKGTLLMVEDEASVRMFGTRALKTKGYEVLEAENGELALQIIEQRGKDIDLIITDVMMPGITGPEMVKEVLDKHPKIKVIFISGYGEDAFIDSYGKEREFFFLPKPFTLDQLASKVKEVL